MRALRAPLRAPLRVPLRAPLRAPLLSILLSSTLIHMDVVNCAPPCIKERKTTNGFLNITNVMIRPVSRDGSLV